MASVTSMIEERSQAAPISIDLGAFRSAQLKDHPFPYVVVPAFVRASAHASIGADFPRISQPGSFPLGSVSYGPAFRIFMDEIQGPAMRRAVEEKFGMDLSAAPTMVTVRGQSRAKDGKIHTDSRSKLLTALVYMNDVWESEKGRLRLLRSPDNLGDVVAEVPPDRGTLLLFRNMPNAWHGFESFEGPRRVIQLNWMTDKDVVRREQGRHALSAFFKRVFNRGH
jgi:hypothetical protein